MPSSTILNCFLLCFLQAQEICDEALDFIETDEERLRLLRPAPKLRRVAKHKRDGAANAGAAAGDGRLCRMRTHLDDEAVVEIFLARLSAGQHSLTIDYMHTNLQEHALVTVECVLGWAYHWQHRDKGAEPDALLCCSCLFVV